MTQELIQNTDEWRQARLGSLGASVVHEVIAKTKTGFSASRANRMASLLLERLTGKAQDIFQTQAMLQGIEREPEARAAYTFQTDNAVQEVGIFQHPELKGTHASPDGLVGDRGLIEIKCVQPAAHLETILEQKIPDRYEVQMLWQMRCSGRDWCDFVSYNPDFPASMQIFVKRINFHTSRVLEIEDVVRQFLVELDEKFSRLNSLYGDKAAA